MQIKTINKTIKAKMDDWVDNIRKYDSKLAKEVLDSIILTGGSVTSLLLNEEVNDYDVYLSNKKTLLKLTNFYITGFENIVVLDGANKSEYIAEIEEDYRNCPLGEIISYRATTIRNLQENQIKLYFPDSKTGYKVDYDSIPNSIKFKKDDKYRPLYFSPNAISLSDDIQIVIRFNGNPEEIHKNYDFVHATNYWTDQTKLVLNLPAVTSILTKQLKYQGSLYPLTSIIRTKKFVSRKWKITAGEMFKMIYQVSKLDLNNIDVLEEQLIGMDVAYFSALIDAIRNISDPSKLNYGYLATMIDRIFDSTDFDDDNVEE